MANDRTFVIVGANSRAAGSAGRAFELTSPGQPGDVDGALECNHPFAAAGGHEGAVAFPNLSLFVITCLDPRVDPAHFRDLGLSDAMVVRNIGGGSARRSSTMSRSSASSPSPTIGCSRSP
jgi:hypothetical protein